MEVKVDHEKCIGCGRCTEICPSTFRLNEQGKSEVISHDDIECAKKAADQCPQEAISVEVEIE
jgi:ferredoxin